MVMDSTMKQRTSFKIFSATSFFRFLISCSWCTGTRYWYGDYHFEVFPALGLFFTLMNYNFKNIYASNIEWKRYCKEFELGVTCSRLTCLTIQSRYWGCFVECLYFFFLISHVQHDSKYQRFCLNNLSVILITMLSSFTGSAQGYVRFFFFFFTKFLPCWK